MDVRFDHFIIEYYLAIVRRKTTHDPPWSSWMPAVSILKTCWCNLNEIKLLESRTSKYHSVYNSDMHQTSNAKKPADWKQKEVHSQVWNTNQHYNLSVASQVTFDDRFLMINPKQLWYMTTHKICWVLTLKIALWIWKVGNLGHHNFQIHPISHQVKNSWEVFKHITTTFSARVLSNHWFR